MDPSWNLAHTWTQSILQMVMAVVAEVGLACSFLSNSPRFTSCVPCQPPHLPWEVALPPT